MDREGSLVGVACDDDPVSGLVIAESSGGLA